MGDWNFRHGHRNAHHERRLDGHQASSRAEIGMSLLGWLSESVESVLARIDGWLKRVDSICRGCESLAATTGVRGLPRCRDRCQCGRGHSAEDIFGDIGFAALLGAVVKSIWWLGAVPPRRRWRELRERRYLKRRGEVPDTLRGSRGLSLAVGIAVPIVAGMMIHRSAFRGSSRRVPWVTDWVTTDARRSPEHAPTARGGPELQ